ncbi:unnamed protein product [Dovyalis caffra]|uniref:Inositol oxygenase n=1 Tax=Dovyalis caffra TaxID=77055 RepID=A0AAV1SVL8_9ROSI|nr:unnamed protein product [Dovyalis caffra]
MFENLKWLQIFNKYDLHSKSKVRIDVKKVKPFYLSLIEKSGGETRVLIGHVARFHHRAPVRLSMGKEYHTYV